MPYPYSITAAIESISGNLQLASNVPVSIYTPQGLLAIIYDDELLANPSTGKNTDGNGDLTFWVDNYGLYRASVNGKTKWISVQGVDGSAGIDPDDWDVQELSGPKLLSDSDNKKYYFYSGVSDISVTAPPGLMDEFRACFDRVDGAGEISFIEGSGASIKIQDNELLSVAKKGTVQLVKRDSVDEFSLFGQLKPLATYVREQCVDMGSSFGAAGDPGYDIGDMAAGKLYHLTGFVSSELNGGSDGDKIQIRFIFPSSEYAISSIVGDGDTGAAPKFFSDNAASGVNSYITIASDDAANKKATISGCIRPTVDGTLLYEIYSTGATMDLDRGLLKITEAPQ